MLNLYLRNTYLRCYLRELFEMMLQNSTLYHFFHDLTARHDFHILKRVHIKTHVIWSLLITDLMFTFVLLLKNR